ncbi:MAG: hypothetical protein WCJ30_13915, partial [Deltaproteobacteria bacterium]
GTLDESLAVVADLNLCRTYIRESEDLIARLSAAINAPSRAHVYMDLRRAREHVFQVLNRVTQLRADVAQALDPAVASSGDVNLQGVVTERHGLDAAVRALPINDMQIRRRDHAAEEGFNRLSQELQRNEQRVSTLEAMVVAIERYVSDPGQQRGNVNIEALRTELVQHRTAIQRYRDTITEIRRLVNAGRSQVGVGDPRYERDLEVGRLYHDMVRREQQGLAGRMPGNASEILARLDAVEQRTLEFDGRLGVNVDRRMDAIRVQVQEEEGRVGAYRGRLATLEADAADIVGHLIMQNFQSVRLHFYQIVMRADLGIVDVAWEQREEHNNRARMLAEEENREIAAFNDEFAEVTEGSTPEPAVRAPAAGASSGSPSPAPAPAAAPAPAPAASSSPSPTTPSQGTGP